MVTVSAARTAGMRLATPMSKASTTRDFFNNRDIFIPVPSVQTGIRKPEGMLREFVIFIREADQLHAQWKLLSGQQWQRDRRAQRDSLRYPRTPDCRLRCPWEPVPDCKA